MNCYIEFRQLVMLCSLYQRPEDACKVLCICNSLGNIVIGVHMCEHRLKKVHKLVCLFVFRKKDFDPPKLVTFKNKRKPVLENQHFQTSKHEMCIMYCLFQKKQAKKTTDVHGAT